MNMRIVGAIGLMLAVMAFVVWLVHTGYRLCTADHNESQLQGVEVHTDVEERNRNLDEDAVDAALARDGWLRR